MGMKEQLQEVSVILPYRISLDIFPLYILSLNVSLTFVEKTYAKWDLTAQIM